MMNNNSLLKHLSISSWIFILFLVGILFNSCVTTRKTTYLQALEESNIPAEYVAPEDYLIQPNDNLFVRVNTVDPRLSAIFNSMPEGGAMTADEQSTQLLSYPVQIDGTVTLPYIGAVEVVGKTLNEATALLEEVLVDYVTDASLTVRLVNNYVTVLGEVNDPGMYPLYKDRLNVFQALAMAGDIADYADRVQLSIIRQTLEGSVVKEFDIRDKNILDSEFYYIMPNDVIYVKPMKGKFFGMREFPFALIFTGITTFILIDSYIAQ